MTAKFINYQVSTIKKWIVTLTTIARNDGQKIHHRKKSSTKQSRKFDVN